MIHHLIARENSFTWLGPICLDLKWNEKDFFRKKLLFNLDVDDRRVKVA